MTPIRLVRMAWAGAVVGAVLGFLYLAYAPIANSHATDTLLTVAVALAGVAVGAVAEIKVERLLETRRTEVTIGQLPPNVEAADHIAAGGS
jgi:hypothetical protein